MKAFADGIPVYCDFSEIVPIEKIQPNPRNPNKHPKSQIELMAKLVREHGWRNPITISTRSGLIVRGGGRYETALHLGVKEVPIDYQHYDSDDMELADLLADNEIARKADTDADLLTSILDDLNLSGAIDMTLTGLTPPEISVLLGDPVDPDEALDEFIEAEPDEEEKAAICKGGDNVSWVVLLAFPDKEAAETYLHDNGLSGAFKRNARTLHIVMGDR